MINKSDKMSREIFEFAAINPVAKLPEPDNSTLKEIIATAFVETHNTEEIEELITKLRVFNLVETITYPDENSLKWVNMFIVTIRQKMNEKS